MSSGHVSGRDWKDLPKRANGTTPYKPHNEMTLLREMIGMPDCDPSYLHGGGGKQPWILPNYGMSAEVELIDAIYALIRLLKPRVVVETGCYLGFTSWAMGRAVLDNHNDGTVTTCDINPEYVRKTRERCRSLPVTVLEHSALSDIMRGWLEDADFCFLDAEQDEDRPKTFEMVKTGAIVLIHDTRLAPWAETIKQKSQRIDFAETWKGFTMLRKME